MIPQLPAVLCDQMLPVGFCTVVLWNTFAILAELPQVQVQVTPQAFTTWLPLPSRFSKGRTVVLRQKLNILFFFLPVYKPGISQNLKFSRPGNRFWQICSLILSPDSIPTKHEYQLKYCLSKLRSNTVLFFFLLLQHHTRRREAPPPQEYSALLSSVSLGSSALLEQNRYR